MAWVHLLISLIWFGRRARENGVDVFSRRHRLFCLGIPKQEGETLQ